MIAIAACLAAAAARAADYASLSQVEAAAETRDYSAQIRDKKFGPEQQAFLRDILLPQLGKDANRSGIARTRQRLRELALRDAAKEVTDSINGVLRDAMLAQATAGDQDPVIRINSMLMVGELVGADGKPWPAAAKPLADAAADATLPLELRIAAVTGLSRHVTSAPAGSPEPAGLAGPVVASLLTAPPEGDAIARRWLIARALDLLPLVAPRPAAIAAAAQLLADDDRDLDLRVRAAAALGRLARPDAGIDAAQAIATIRGLAITALETDLTAAEDRRSAKKLAGGGAQGSGTGWREGPGFGPPAGGFGSGFGGGFGAGFGGEFGTEEGFAEELDEDAVPPLACRRNAWRLYMLAEAIRPARTGPGLAELLAGDAAATAADLATTLRQAALDLDAQPTERTLKEGLESIQSEAAPAGAQPGNAAGKPPRPAGDSKPAASPFEQPAEQSPF